MIINFVNIWNNILEKLKLEISDLNFKNYLKNTSLEEKNEYTLYLICNSGSRQKEYIKNNYKNLIEKLLFESLQKQYDLEICTKDDLKNKLIEDDNTFVEKTDIVYEHKSKLNKNLNFDNFIVGKSNEIAVEIAKMVALNPGIAYNPFYLYGESGVGKTHLIQAIGNYIENNTNKKVLYVETDEFISDFTTISRENKIKGYQDKVIAFKQKYRGVDVLIIDDIQSLETTKTSQTEFFNVFNDLHNNQKQIILASDLNPNDLDRFENRLRTRFLWKGSFNIDPPDYELKKNITISKIKENNINLIDQKSIEYISNNISDTRLIEGAIQKILIYYSIYGRCDLESTMEAIKDLISKPIITNNNIDKIKKVVADYYRISVEDLIIKNKRRDILIPRQIAIYLCCKITKENLIKIGSSFGVTHSTVLHGNNKIDQQIKKDIHFKKVIKDLENEIKLNTFKQ